MVRGYGMGASNSGVVPARSIVLSSGRRVEGKYRQVYRDAMDEVGQNPQRDYSVGVEAVVVAVREDAKREFKAMIARDEL